jgi:hypothetical protein
LTHTIDRALVQALRNDDTAGGAKSPSAEALMACLRLERFGAAVRVRAESGRLQTAKATEARQEERVPNIEKRLKALREYLNKPGVRRGRGLARRVREHFRYDRRFRNDKGELISEQQIRRHLKKISYITT